MMLPTDPLLIFTALTGCFAGMSMYVSSTDPNPQTSDEAKRHAKQDRLFREKSAFDTLIRVNRWPFFKQVCICLGFGQALFLFSPSANATVSSLWPTLLFNLVAISGAMGRLWCYRTLQHFFTFNLSIQKDHRIVQAGPYRYLVHPSYTFFFLNALGTATAVLGSFNPLLVEAFSRLPPYATTIWIVFQVLMPLSHIRNLSLRITDEEAMMKERFGRQWEEHVRQRWRLIPLIW